MSNPPPDDLTPPGDPTDQAGPGVSDATPPPTSAAVTDSFTLPPDLPRPGPRSVPNPFGRYHLIRQLGRGGMGFVHLAHDPHMDRLVALKVPQLDGLDSAHLRERFLIEARSAGLVHHPNICPVYEVGQVDGWPYLTMAVIDGRPLGEWAAGGRSVPEIVRVIRALALALDEAHRAGVVHRDLKPSNVMIDRRGEPVVMDFGLARRLALPAEPRLTPAGMLLGTPAYMPPEQVAGSPDAGRAGDVYSLGVILFELLAGRLPFVGSVAAMLAQIESVPAPPVGQFRPGLDPRLEGAVHKALAKRPADRHAGMAAFAEVLGGLATPAETPPRAGPSPAPRPAAGPDPILAQRVLELLRRWGWAEGVQRVRKRARLARGEGEKAGWQGYLDWMSGDRGDPTRGAQALTGVPEGLALRGWLLAGKASWLLRERDYAGALRWLDRATAEGDPGDMVLQGTVSHTRAAALVHLSRADEALPHLHAALASLGADHFVTGRVLDTLGMAYAVKGNFPVAREFYQQSIRFKGQCDDEAGLAISHGQLGRLHLDWGHLDEAERHFKEDLRLAQKIRSRWSEAQLYNHLGQVALARAEREAPPRRRRYLADAAGWLEESLRVCHEGGYTVSEGFTRKDRALVYLAEGQLDAAEEQARLAAERFTEGQFAEGLAKAQHVEGMVLRARERWPEAERKFRTALQFFESSQMRDEAVRTRREIARTLRDSGAALPLVTRWFREALTRAESCRHALLVSDIEREWHDCDPEAYLRHVYERSRGADPDDDSPSLMDSMVEVLTVLSLDLPGFTDFSHGLDPQDVLLTYNQLMADFSDVLDRHQGRVTTYRGNGLIAVVRDARHAERGVQAALDLVAALEEFNRPRELLGLPVFHVRIGVSSGEALLGNVGTYRKIDFTALGAAVNLAGALRNEARHGVPCASRATWDLLRGRYACADSGPRDATFVGFGTVQVYDVTGPR